MARRVSHSVGYAVRNRRGARLCRVSSLQRATDVRWVRPRAMLCTCSGSTLPVLFCMLKRPVQKQASLLWPLVREAGVEPSSTFHQGNMPCFEAKFIVGLTSSTPDSNNVLITIFDSNCTAFRSHYIAPALICASSCSARWSDGRLASPAWFAVASVVT